MKMPKINFNKHVKHLERLITDNSPMILTALGVVGVAGTAGLTWKAATEAERTIADLAGQKNLHREADEQYYTTKDFTAKEKFAATWKLYIAPCTVGVLSCAAIIGAQKINARRAAALAGLLAMTQDDFKEYKTKVKEKMTGPAHNKMETELAQDQLNRLDERQQLENIDVAEGDVLCVEMYTDRAFSSSRNKIEKAVNEFNRRVINQNGCELSQFYDILRLNHTDASDEIGFNPDVLMEVDWKPVFTAGGRPAQAFSYVDPPMHRPWEGAAFRGKR